MWRHYTPLLVKNWPKFAGLWKMRFKWICKFKTPIDVKWEALQDGYVGFFNIFGFWRLKFQKKMDPKNQNIQNVQKPVTCVIKLLVFYQCTKFQVDSSIFDPPNGVFLSPKSYLFMTSFFQMRFLKLLGVVRKNNDTVRFPSQSWSRLARSFPPGVKMSRCGVPCQDLLLSTFINLKIWLFDLTLTRPSLKTFKNGLRRSK